MLEEVLVVRRLEKINQYFIKDEKKITRGKVDSERVRFIFFVVSVMLTD